MTVMLRDAAYGQAVGDALGVPYEFKKRGSFHAETMTGHGTHDQPAGTWSDDTSMALAICDSIRANDGRIDVTDMRARFEDWYRHDAYTVDGLFDIGNTTVEALTTGRGCDGEWDNGNGSLMRTIPLAFTDATDDEIRAVSAITHAHPTSMDACVRLVAFARLLIAGRKPVQALSETKPVRADVASLPETEIRSGGYVLNTLLAAIWCLLTTDSYAACVLKAVNLGADADTTAAVAGGLAGIVYGVDGIPADWMAMLRGKQVIEQCLF
ncbi:ADP-ribosylglycohydrolase family protein [Bifidobacterium platyrrhinorum]|uniref:ADP-ribosylglycohydrolase n=1 Tax=Bifidobacterium platyrrhinorum TaxID=2661628 RepID=A0A6L9SR44_9BIFI|nr:ADP-ribosylglycohydrolase family protein [Bifidobacterium platyrrhinorum]NEG54489.1 ADP-ribosylglycohydrolase [Bifidobacterium platyrrhinorum]